MNHRRVHPTLRNTSLSCSVCSTIPSFFYSSVSPSPLFCSRFGESWKSPQYLSPSDASGRALTEKGAQYGCHTACTTNLVERADRKGRVDLDGAGVSVGADDVRHHDRVARRRKAEPGQ